MQAGDTITATVTATSTTNGTASLRNTRTGQTLSQTMSGRPALCLQTAEWVVQNWYNFNTATEQDELGPLAGFGTISFTNTAATTVGGQTINATNATLVQMVDNNWNPQATASITPAGGVTVVYDAA
jgi:hypothetical protein